MNNCWWEYGVEETLCKLMIVLWVHPIWETHKCRKYLFNNLILHFMFYNLGIITIKFFRVCTMLGDTFDMSTCNLGWEMSLVVCWFWKTCGAWIKLRIPSMYARYLPQFTKTSEKQENSSIEEKLIFIYNHFLITFPILSLNSHLYFLILIYDLH